MSLSTLSLFRPSNDAVRALLRENADACLTYDAVGATFTTVPAGWTLDEREVVLGRGEAVFDSAKHAMRRWAQFNLGWVVPVSTEVPIEEGAVFSFLARSLGFWTVNVCRVVHVVDELDARRGRFGFAYGTVGMHAVRGEERFVVTWDRETDEVRFGIRKFSLPGSFLVAAMGPVARWIQGRFTRDALARMQVEVRLALGVDEVARVAEVAR